MIRVIIARLFCKHEFIDTDEGSNLFGKDHVTKVCVKCGKRKY